MSRFIRHRLLTIVLLGVLTSAVPVFALVQLLTTSTSQRVERARDAIVDEVERMALDPSRLAEPTATTIVALRAGVWVDDRTPAALPAPFVERVHAAVLAARTQGRRVVVESALDEATMVVGARKVINPAEHGQPADAVVFAAYSVRPLPSVRTWQRIVAVRAALTVLLVATAVTSIVTVNRGVAALRASLDALATNLEAEVPRPSVRELDGIADGIAGLARKLAEARVKKEYLARELAQNERLAALGRVAAGVAHEVRNPLASIKLRLDLAAATPPRLPEAAEKGIAHATSEIERLDRLVADLLLVAARAVGPKGRTCLGALVRARVDGLAPWALERGVALEVSGEGPALIDADSTARAVDNLLRNAVEASASGQCVTARVTRADGRVTVRVEDAGKLLRVLEDGSFERVGGSEVLTTRARVIAATNKPVHPGEPGCVLREDLYYLLAVIDIEVLPLRARKSDIPLLVAHALRGTPVRAASEQAMEVLTAYDWPGNVRELVHVIERAAVLGGEIVDVAPRPTTCERDPLAARASRRRRTRLRAATTARTLRHRSARPSRSSRK